MRALRSGSARCTCQIAAQPCAPPSRFPSRPCLSSLASQPQPDSAQRSRLVTRPAAGMAQREHRALDRIPRVLAGMNRRAFCLHAQ